MVFGIIIILLIGVVTYFHYLQGFFSAGISAIIAIVAAVAAVGWHETVISMVLGGKFADYAHAGGLVGMFALIYLVLRVIFDQLIPGNVRFPFMVEKIGSAVMGVIAGIFGTGIIAMAAQMLPFSPSVGGYERYAMEYGKKINLRQLSKSQNDEAIYDELKDEEKFRGGQSSGLLVPVDEMVIGLVSMASDKSGALSYERPLLETHPDWLTELFGQRIIQTGSKRTALPDRTSLVGIYTAPSFPQIDPERVEINKTGIGVRSSDRKPPLTDKLPPVYTPDKEKGRVLVIVRLRVNRDDTDDVTNVFAFSPSCIRLCANRKNYFPIGTLEGGTVMYANAVDDHLFGRGDKCIDLVFDVEDGDVLAPISTDARQPQPVKRKTRSDAFLEVKRLARVPLSGQELRPIEKPKEEEYGMVRKQMTVPGANTPGGR